ncbi:MAG: MopE-related protein [Saprospiraceae bacterium]
MKIKLSILTYLFFLTIMTVNSQPLELISKYDFSRQGNFEYKEEIVASTVRIDNFIYTVGWAEDLGPQGFSTDLLWCTKLTLDGTFVESKSFQIPIDPVKKAIINTVGNIVVIGGNNDSYMIEISPELEVLRFKGTSESINDIVANDDGTYAAVLGRTGTSYTRENSRILLYDSDFNFTNYIYVPTSTNNVNFSRIIKDENAYIIVGDYRFSPFPNYPNISSKGLSDLFILKTTFAGQVEWIKSFGGARYDYVNEREDISNRDEFIEAKQGGYYFTCTSQSSDNEFSNGIGNTSAFRTWLFHVSDTGDLIWNTCTQAQITDIASPNSNEVVVSTISGTFNNERINCSNCSFNVAWIGVFNATDGTFNRQAFLDGEDDDIITDIEVSNNRLLLFGITESYEEAGPFFEDEDDFDDLDAIFAKYQIITGAGVTDNDNDGYLSDVDCDDNNPNVNPGAQEICNNIDDNCNGQIDEGLLITYFLDADGDGFGDINNSMDACSLPSGYTTDNTDCDDTNPQINPDATEIPDNGIDENCDGVDGNGGSYQIRTIEYVTRVDSQTGRPLHLGENVILEGIVHGTNSLLPERLHFSLIDDLGQGIWIFEPFYFQARPNQGDHIQIKGTVSEFNGQTQLSEITEQIIIFSSNNELVEPVSTNILNESNEAELVEISGVYLKDQTEWNENTSFSCTVTNGHIDYELRVDRSKNGAIDIEKPNGTFNVIGLVGQFDPTSPHFDGYQILPRYQSDLVETSGTKNSRDKNSQIIVYPNPASDEIFVEGKSYYQRLELKTLTGKTLFLTYDSFVDISNFSPGVYIIQIADEYFKLVKQ